MRGGNQPRAEGPSSPATSDGNPQRFRRRVVDVNERANLAGAGINMAKRVMKALQRSTRQPGRCGQPCSH